MLLTAHYVILLIRVRSTHNIPLHDPLTLFTCAGFQTHETPVLLAAEDRAELADDQYVATTPLLEGFVIVRSNPDHVPADGEKGQGK